MSECNSGTRTCAKCDGRGYISSDLVSDMIGIFSAEILSDGPNTKPCHVCDETGEVTCVDCNGAGCD
jgi:RecJ-like exonuclease